MYQYYHQQEFWSASTAERRTLENEKPGDQQIGISNPETKASTRATESYYEINQSCRRRSKDIARWKQSSLNGNDYHFGTKQKHIEIIEIK